jgi:RNA polymerase sigma factor (sigma-70 family)
MSSPEPSDPAVSFDGFEDFLRRVEPKLKRVLARSRIPVDDAEDELQETLYALVYQWERVRDPECWLMATLKRRCQMYWRTRRRRFYAAVEPTLLEWLAEPIPPPQERTDLLCDLENLLGRLHPRCRSLLDLRFRQGFEAPEVAERLGYRASSIGKITTRCLAALSRELLSAGLGPESGKSGASGER